MKEFYYQIKGQKGNKQDPDMDSGIYDSHWVFPPIWSDIIRAKDKAHAKARIEKDYKRKFPLRVLAKDLASNEFLLSIRELKEHDHFTRSFFEYKTCPICKCTYRIIDKYHIGSRGGSHCYCSEECDNKAREERHENYEYAYFDEYTPKIYKITNKKTGLCYIGQTKQAFTLRWYQHFFQTGANKFHEAIRNSTLVDWTFEIIEEIIIDKAVYDMPSKASAYITEREQYYIDKYDSVENGYNSVVAISEKNKNDKKQLELEVK